MPAFAKTASLVDKHADRRRDQDYGLIVVAEEGNQRLYPIYDKANTWLSAKFLSNNWEGMPKNAAAIAARSVAGMAEIFEIDIPPIVRKLAGLAPEKSTRYYEPSAADLPLIASREPEKCASIELDGTVFPVRSFGELSEAERWFDRSHFDMKQASKYKMAEFLARRRVELTNEDAQMEKDSSWMYKSKEVAKTAELTEFDENKFVVAMCKRASLCPDPEFARAYAKMAVDAKLAMIGGPLAAIDMIESFDVNSNLRDSYNRWIPDAISSVLSKKAEPVSTELPDDAQIEFKNVKHGSLDFEDGYLPAGRVKKALESDKLKKLLGEKMAAQLARNPAQISEMPPSIAGYIYDIASSC